MQLTVSAKQVIDRTAGGVLLFGLALFCAIARALGRRHAGGGGEPRKILITKFLGAGSFVAAKPAIASLKSAFPHCEIYFWGTQATCAIAELSPEIDRTIVLRDTGIVALVASLIQNLSAIRRCRVDWAFDLEAHSDFSAIFTFLTGAKNRLGLSAASSGYAWPRKQVFHRLVDFTAFQPLSAVYSTLFNAPASHGSPASFWKELEETSLAVSSPFIIVNPHASALSAQRRLAPDQCKTLIERLSVTFPRHTLVMTGADRREEEYNASFSTMPNVVNAAGRCTVTQLIDLVRRAEAIVTVDSLVLHLSLLEKRPLVGLFGPTLPESFFARQSSNVMAITHRLACSPCVHGSTRPPCRGDNQCMKQISADEIVSALRQVLAGRGEKR